MTTYLYQCQSCMRRFESTTSAPVLKACRKPGCPGTPKRVPGVAFHRDGDPPLR